jgi:hypothetical protein
MADGSLNDLIGDDKRAHAVDLQRFAAGENSKAVRSLRALEKEIIARLTDSELDAGLLTSNQKRRLELLLADVEATISTVYGDIDSEHTATMQDLRWSASRS